MSESTLPGQAYRSPMQQPGRPETIAGVIGDLTGNVSTLIRQEILLAKAEVRQSAIDAGRGAGLYLGAGVAGFLVLMFASVAAWWGIGNETGRGWAALIVAGCWLLIAGVLAMVARQRLARVKGTPQTTDTLAKVPNALKGNERNNR